MSLQVARCEKELGQLHWPQTLFSRRSLLYAMTGKILLRFICLRTYSFRRRRRVRMAGLVGAGEKCFKNRLPGTSLRFVENFLKKSVRKIWSEYIYSILAPQKSVQGERNGKRSFRVAEPPPDLAFSRRFLA